MSEPAYVVGIDLGTTNIVVAYAPLAKADDRASADIRLLPIPQLVGPGQLIALPSLPAVRYHPGPELERDLARLPWPPGPVARRLPAAIQGRWALELGSHMPERLVQSAKSWLGIADAQHVRLPWQAAEHIATVSPLEATAGYLEYLRQAWQQQHPEHPLAQQRLIITIPASFDDLARSLTLEAAAMAGLPRPTLLEEPLAACYDWLHRAGGSHALAAVRTLLVCDIGGGTSDFTLIRVTPDADEPRLERMSVGDHLMIGGDNMDLALAVQLQRKLTAGKPLRPRALLTLLQQCRQAKEQLLAEDAPEEIGISLLGSGAALIGGSRQSRLTRKEVDELVLEGFFPQVPLDARPLRRPGALRQWGLPYPDDGAISRHLADFLQRHTQAEDPFPDALLVNGSPFHSPKLARRLHALLEAWRGAPVTWLANQEPGLAVARGAAHFGWQKLHQKRLIQSGAARSYFILAEGAAGKEAICILPKGTPEARPCTLPQPLFTLRCGRPVQFELASSTDDTPYAPGQTAEAMERLHHLPRLTTTLAGDGSAQVRLSSVLTEIGVLEVTCQATDESRRHWPLAFNLRRHESDAAQTPAADEAWQQARAQLLAVYGPGRPAVALAPRTLRQALEKPLGPRATWSGALARQVADELIAQLGKRRRSESHERVWFNLTGYAMRPGIGMPGDRARMDALWPLYPQGLQHGKETASWHEWWVFWRRIAAGLEESRQMQLLDEVGVVLVPGAARKGSAAMAAEEQVRLLGSLERIVPAIKARIGELLLQRILDGREVDAAAWALARLGARKLAYAPADYRVPAAEVSDWLNRLLLQDWKRQPEFCFTAAALSRHTGQDDVDEALRAQILEQLHRSNAAARWLAWVEGESGSDQAEGERHQWGDSLPVGLVIE